jgi:hypothetical protein
MPALPLLADRPDDVQRVLLSPGGERGVLRRSRRAVDAGALLVPAEGVRGVPDVRDRPGRADGRDGVHRVPAEREQDREADRRAAVDAHAVRRQVLRTSGTPHGAYPAR